MAHTVASERSRITAAGNQTRLKKNGYTFKRDWQIRGGQVCMHLRFHSEKFNPKCLICLEELNCELFPVDYFNLWLECYQQRQQPRKKHRV